MRWLKLKEQVAMLYQTLRKVNKNSKTKVKIRTTIMRYLLRPHNRHKSSLHQVKFKKMKQINLS